ncbi:hypothetical protein D3C85_1418610 [compost metagenome]
MQANGGIPLGQVRHQVVQLGQRFQPGGHHLRLGRLAVEVRQLDALVVELGGGVVVPQQLGIESVLIDPLPARVMVKPALLADAGIDGAGVIQPAPLRYAGEHRPGQLVEVVRYPVGDPLLDAAHALLLQQG